MAGTKSDIKKDLTSLSQALASESDFPESPQLEAHPADVLQPSGENSLNGFGELNLQELSGGLPDASLTPPLENVLGGEFTQGAPALPQELPKDDPYAPTPVYEIEGDFDMPLEELAAKNDFPAPEIEPLPEEMPELAPQSLEPGSPADLATQARIERAERAARSEADYKNPGKTTFESHPDDLPAELTTPDVEQALSAIHEEISDVGVTAGSSPTRRRPEAKRMPVPTAASIPTGENWARANSKDDAAVSRKSVAAASFPFSLLITGVLSPEEREKLSDVLAREKMGISEIDLEPQYASGRVLIPRISEYAGVLLVQTMRSASVKMTLGPSDTIFATDDTRSTQEEIDQNSDQATPGSIAQIVSDTSHPAEEVMVTPDDKLPSLRDSELEVIDTLTASATMKAKFVESENSAAFQDLLENLKRELKYKAHRKGAVGIIHFSVQLMPLQMTASYRVTVMGAAVRSAGAAGSLGDFNSASSPSLKDDDMPSA